MSYVVTDTIVALATPSGSGAIAVIRLSGSDAIKIVNQVFKGKDLTKQASHTIHFGTIRDKNLILDEVLVSLFIAPKSYTKENVVEISTHGSIYIIESIIKLLIRHGARAANPGEFTLRSFLNGGMDLSQAEAVADLISSNSRLSHQIALKQMRGGFSNELNGLREQLIHFASMIELELDFSEEDVEFANRNQLKNLIIHIINILQQLIQSFNQGNVLKNGIPVAIMGKPNAGKSSLLNALLNEDRAIVSNIPGTTRDSIEDTLMIEGMLFRFIDTAGLRETDDTIEAFGIQKAKEKAAKASIILYLYDKNDTSPSEIILNVKALHRDGVKFILVQTKTDITNGFHDDGFLKALDEIYPELVNPITAVSVYDPQSVKSLKATLAWEIKEDISDEGHIITNIRHLEALQKTEEALKQVLENLESPVTSDFLAMDIKQALHYLGEITGSVTTDDLLENIFSKFCIGK